MVRTMLAVVLVLFALAAPAQAQAPKFGVIAGANLTRLHITDPPGQITDIYHGQTVPGLGAVVTSQLFDRVAIRMDLTWLQKGQTISESLFGVPASLDLTYFEIPLLGIVDLTGGRLRPYVAGGPSVGLLLSAYITSEGASTDYKESFRSVDFSLTGGAGVAWVASRSRVFIETRYMRGLTNIESSATRTMNTRGLQIMLGITAR